MDIENVFQKGIPKPNIFVAAGLLSAAAVFRTLSFQRVVAPFLASQAPLTSAPTPILAVAASSH